MDGDLLWRSPNGNWEVYESAPRWPADMDDPYSYLFKVEVSNGWAAGDVICTVGGNIIYDEFVLNSAPKYVRDRVESILMRRWKQEVGNRPVDGYRFVVIPARVNERGTRVWGDAIPFTNRRDAFDAADRMWDAIPEDRRELGDLITVGQTDRWSDDQRFSYNHLYEYSYEAHPEFRQKTRSGKRRTASASSRGGRPKAHAKRKAPAKKSKGARI